MKLLTNFFNIAGGIFSILIECLFCVAGYFLLDATISVISAGGLIAIIGGIFLIPITAGVLIGGLISSVMGIFKGVLSGKKWYVLMLQFLILCAFVLVIVLNFVI